jgi:hypothetical protein
MEYYGVLRTVNKIRLTEHECQHRWNIIIITPCGSVGITPYSKASFTKRGAVPYQAAQQQVSPNSRVVQTAARLSAEEPGLPCY